MIHIRSTVTEFSFSGCGLFGGNYSSTSESDELFVHCKEDDLENKKQNNKQNIMTSTNDYERNWRISTSFCKFEKDICNNKRDDTKEVKNIVNNKKVIGDNEITAAPPVDDNRHTNINNQSKKS